MRKWLDMGGRWCVLTAVVLTVGPILLLVAGSLLPEELMEMLPDGLSFWERIWDGQDITTEQYRSVLFASPDYLFRFWNSFRLVVPTVAGQLILSALTAYGLARGKGRFYSGILFLYLVLMVTPYQVSVIPNYYAVKELGLLETDFAIWLPGIFSPFPVYLLTKCMKRIPSEIVEAAQLDGAGSLRIFMKIMLPLCRGQIVALGILVFADYWNQVELPLVMFSDAFRYPLSVFLSKIREEAVGISLAATVIYTIPVLLIFLYGADELKAGFLGENR